MCLFLCWCRSTPCVGVLFRARLTVSWPSAANNLKGYGHSVIFLAYFLTTLSSPKMKRDLLTVKQFSLTGMGLYKAMVRARCALVCLKAGEMPPVDTAAPSRFRLRSDPPSPELNKPGMSSPKRAILSEKQNQKKERKGGKTPEREDTVRVETERQVCSLREKAGRGAALGVTDRLWPLSVRHQFEGCRIKGFTNSQLRKKK